MIPPNFVRDARDLEHLADGVNANNVCPREHGRRHRGRRSPVTRRGRHAASKRPREERLARRPDDERASELAEFVEARERLEAVRRLLREAETGIDEDARLAD